MTDYAYLIIGNGVAGLTTAETIRSSDRRGSIGLIADEGEPYYYRASMSEWLSGETTDEMLPGRTARFYDDMNLVSIRGHVERVDPDASRVYLASGEDLGYSELLIATGARANIYPVEGLDEILAFRTLADVRRIKERIGCCGRALIVGGGILGLELAGALHKMGIERIAVVQRSGHVGKPLLDPPAAEWLQARMRRDGIDLFLNDVVQRVDGSAAEVAGGGRAMLRSGERWDFDILVQAVGITPVFPAVPGLDVGRGIRIDARCRTNLPHIYAAGDCTETKAPGGDTWRPTRIWLQCAQQASVAGRNMAGLDDTLPQLAYFNASVIYIDHYAYIGEPHGDGGQVYLWQQHDGYRKFRVLEGRLAGALLLGERRGSMAILNAIGQPVADYGAAIARPDFPYNDLTGRDWDYLFW